MHFFKSYATPHLEIFRWNTADSCPANYGNLTPQNLTSQNVTPQSLTPQNFSVHDMNRLGPLLYSCVSCATRVLSQLRIPQKNFVISYKIEHFVVYLCYLCVVSALEVVFWLHCLSTTGCWIFRRTEGFWVLLTNVCCFLPLLVVMVTVPYQNGFLQHISGELYVVHVHFNPPLHTLLGHVPETSLLMLST